MPNSDRDYMHNPITGSCLVNVASRTSCGYVRRIWRKRGAQQWECIFFVLYSIAESVAKYYLHGVEHQTQTNNILCTLPTRSLHAYTPTSRPNKKNPKGGTRQEKPTKLSTQPNPRRDHHVVWRHHTGCCCDADRGPLLALRIGATRPRWAGHIYRHTQFSISDSSRGDLAASRGSRGVLSAVG